MTVRFEESGYDFMEGSNETSSVCLVSSGESDIPFTVSLGTLSGTAEGMMDMHDSVTHITDPTSILLGTLDYRVIEGANLTFEVSQQRKCIDIAVIDDAVLESDESFTLILASSSESISVLTRSCTVSITDDDGMFLKSSDVRCSYCFPLSCDCQLGASRIFCH